MNINIIEKINKIEAEIKNAKLEGKKLVETKTTVLWTENLDIRTYFEDLGYYVYPCIDSSLDGHYIVDWSN